MNILKPNNNITDNRGISGNTENIPFVPKEVIKSNLDQIEASEGFKQHVEQTTNNIYNKFSEDKNSSESYSAYIGGKTAIEKNAFVFNNDPKKYFESTEKELNKIVNDNENIPKDERDRIYKSLIDSKLDNYFKLQSNILKQNQILGREDSIRQFDSQKEDLIKFASVEEGMREGVLEKFNNIIDNSNYGKKYITDDEKQYITEDFLLEYDREATWKDIASMPNNVGIQKVSDMQDLDMTHRFFQKTENDDNDLMAPDSTDNDRVHKLLSEDILKVSNENGVDNRKLDNIISLGSDEIASGVISSIVHDDNKFTFGNQNSMIKRNVFLNNYNEENILEAYNSKEIDIDTKEHLLNMVRPMNEIDQHFMDAKASFLGKINSQLALGSDEDEYHNFAIKNNNNMGLSNELTDSVISVLSDIQGNIRSGKIQNIETVNDQMSNLELQKNNIINKHTQLTKGIDLNVIGLKEAFTEINNLKTGSGNFFGSSIQDIEKYLDDNYYE